MYISSTLLPATEYGNKTRSATATNSVNTVHSTVPFPISLADGIFQSPTYFIQSIKLFSHRGVNPNPFPSSCPPHPLLLPLLPLWTLNSTQSPNSLFLHLTKILLSKNNLVLLPRNQHLQRNLARPPSTQDGAFTWPSALCLSLP